MLSLQQTYMDLSEGVTKYMRIIKVLKYYCVNLREVPSVRYNMNNDIVYNAHRIKYMYICVK